MRVTYGRTYVIGMIESFREGNDFYKVEQRESKLIATLRNGGKSKEFKLNAISDSKVTE